MRIHEMMMISSLFVSKSIVGSTVVRLKTEDAGDHSNQPGNVTYF